MQNDAQVVCEKKSEKQNCGHDSPPCRKHAANALQNMPAARILIGVWCALCAYVEAARGGTRHAKPAPSTLLQASPSLASPEVLRDSFFCLAGMPTQNVRSFWVPGACLWQCTCAMMALTGAARVALLGILHGRAFQSFLLKKKDAHA